MALDFAALLRSLIDLGDSLDSALAVLRVRGATYVDSIKAVRQVQAVSLREAWDLVGASPAWDEAREPLDRPITENLPWKVLLDLLPAAFEPWGPYIKFPSRPPTAESVKRIESALGITIPPLFIEVATACPAYGGWFNSIGDDYEHHTHILILNASLHAEGLPSRYVLINHGHDGDCDAWDLDASPIGGEPPIVYFHYDDEEELEDRAIRRLEVSALSFADYIDRRVRWAAPRCSVEALRLHAERVLGEYGGT
jgi:hypothetical protein